MELRHPRHAPLLSRVARIAAQHRDQDRLARAARLYLTLERARLHLPRRRA